jgi:hypothetical protein
MSIVTLSLPALPQTTINKIAVIADSMARDNEPRYWLNNYHSTNSVNQQFSVASDLTAEINEIYAEYFNQSVTPMIGVMRNVTDQPACLPPHCDRARYIAINYYIDLGGNNVQTCFYDYYRTSDDLTESKNIIPSELTLSESAQFNKNTWYSYSVQQCHSVENILTTRTFLGLVLENNLTFTQFCQEYKDLIEQINIKEY